MKLTTNQVAERLKISNRHVRRLITDGKLPSLKRDGKEWFIEEEAVSLYEQGHSKDIKKKLDILSEYADYIIANPETIKNLQEKNLPFNSQVITYENYLDRLFKEKRVKAEIRIKNLPLLDSNIGNPQISALYDEFRECFVLGVNGAAITLAIILLEYACKYRLLISKGKTPSASGWKSVDGLLFKETIEKLYIKKAINDFEKEQLLSFNDDIRNNYMHYKIRKIIKDMIILELPKLNVKTGEIVIQKDVDVKKIPQLWFSAKKRNDEIMIISIASFCIDWTNKLIKDCH